MSDPVLTQSTEATIVGVDVMAEHPELHHYTTRAGLEGIVTSQTLWATHYDDLNDTTEVTHLRNRLRPELIERFQAILRRRRINAEIDAAIRETGGMNKAATDLADDLIRSFYSSAFAEEDLGGTSVTAGAPFIASLCTHRAEDYESTNGLLSQWRGYAGQAGFCLVFDTAKLAQMLGREFDRGSYTHLNLNSVHYAFPATTVAALFPDLVATCEAFVESALSREPALGDGIAQFFAAATLLKHRAFHEEREVRIVAIPMSDRMRELVEKEHPGVKLGPAKPILSIGEAATKRYIELFRDATDPLPIKRVIVGPSRNQAELVDLAQAISAGRFDVIPSETPFKG
jgi:hypothetical protein